MHNLNDQVEYCKSLLDQTNILYNRNAIFSINKRAKTRWGQCQHRGVVDYINISSVLLDERVPVKGLQQTILHEFLHTAPNCQNHGYFWKNYAAEVNNRFGYNISRCNTEDEFQIPEDLRVRNSINTKYTVVCEKCGHQIRRQRASNLTKNPSRYIHRACGGHFVSLEEYQATQKLAASSQPQKIEYMKDEGGQMRLPF